MGSFQLFVSGYRDGSLFLRDVATSPLPENLTHSFRHQFERLVVMDYIMRNTGTTSDCRLVWPL